MESGEKRDIENRDWRKERGQFDVECVWISLLVRCLGGSGALIDRVRPRNPIKYMITEALKNMKSIGLVQI